LIRDNPGRPVPEGTLKEDSEIVTTNSYIELVVKSNRTVFSMTAAIVVAYDFSKILELEEELKVVGNNMKSLEISEQEVSSVLRCHTCTWLMDG